MNDKEKEVKKDEKEKVKEVEKESTDETVKEVKQEEKKEAEMENWAEKKKSNGSGVIIFILIVIILGLVFYIAYDKGLILNNNKNTNDPKVTEKDKNNDKDKDTDVVEDKVVELSLDDDLVKDNYKKVMQHSATYTYFKDSRVKAKDLSNEFVTYVALSNALGKFGQANVTKEQMEKVVHGIFGKDYPFEHLYYPNNHGFLRYNPDTGIYEYQVDQLCGGTLGPSNIASVVKAYKDSKTLTFEIGVLFFSGSDGKYYKDYQKTIQPTDLELNQNSFPTWTVENVKKGTIYKMVFNLEDGNYVFSYVEPMNS